MAIFGAGTSLGRLVVSIEADVSKLNSGLKKAEQDIKRSTDAIVALTNRVGMALIGIGAGITAASGLAVKAAMEQEKATAKLAAAMRNTGTYTEQAIEQQLAFASAMQEATLYADEEITSMQSLLVELAGLSGKQLQDATKATIGLATAMGTDLDTSARRIALALEGTTSGLGRYGIEIKEGMSQSQRFAAILAAGEKHFGLATAATETAAGKMIQFRKAVNELQEAIGAVLLPKLAEMLTWLTGVVRRTQDWLTQHPKVKTMLVEWGTTVGIAAFAFGTMLVVLGKLLQPMLLLVKYTGTAAAALRAWTVAAYLANPALTLITAGIAALAAGFLLCEKNLKYGFLGAFTAALDSVKAQLAQFVGWIQSNPALRAVAQMIWPGFGVAAPMLTAGIGKASEAIKGAAGIPEGEELALAAPAVAIGAPAEAGIPGAPSVEPILTWRDTFLQTLAEVSEGMTNLFDEANMQIEATGQELVTSWVSMADAIIGTVSTAWNSFRTTAATALSDMILGAKSVRDAFAEMGKAMIKAIVDFVAQKMIDWAMTQVLLPIIRKVLGWTMKGIAEEAAPAAAMVSLATAGTNAIPAAAGIAGTVALAKTLAAAAVPAAEGAIFSRPTLAMVGEGGEAEAVAPLSKLFAMIQAATVGKPNVALNFDGDVNIRTHDDLESFASELARLVRESSLATT